MSETPIHAEDGSPMRAAPIKETPFKHPMSAHGKPPGVDNDNDAGSESDQDQPIDPRMAVIEAASAAADEDRMIAPGTRQEDMPMGEPVPQPDDDRDPAAESEGLQSIEQMHEDEPEPGLPDEFADDPLSEFIVMEGDDAMFRTVVNGQEQLIPLEKARATIQKQESADQRLQEANLRTRNVEAREQAIAQREGEIAARIQALATTPAQPSPEDAAQADEDLEREAREVVNGLFTGSEDEAAAKLAKLLKDAKGAGTPATQIDPEQLAADAAAAARQQLTDEAIKKDVKAGFKQFSEDYPEIAADDKLFRFADSLTDAIAAEHPDWMPSQVMLEAGKQVRDQFSKEESSEQPDPEPNNDRRERKRKLRPMPRARQGTKEKEPEEQPETPANVLADIRAARGQAV